MIIGLTGGVGSGKSATAKYFKDIGIDIIDADYVAKNVLIKNSAGYKLFIHKFGNKFLDKKNEIDGIKALIVKAISDQVPELIDQRVKLNFFGNIEDFGSKIIDKINKAQNDTSLSNPSLELNVALGYGGRNDIVNTTKILAKKVHNKEINIKDINEDIFSQLSLVPVDNIDLVIRTGGDKRLSNFLLFQIAYAEIMFIEKLWPDFTKEDFISCLESFKNVERRFGKRI